MTNSELVKIIKNEIEKSSYLDVGESAELKLGVSKEQLETALKSLEKKGYKRHRITIKQATNPLKENSVQVMSKGSINSNYIDERNSALNRVALLIANMTLDGATQEELERAILYSVDIIRSKKDGTDWKQSYEDHVIADLENKYQG